MEENFTVNPLFAGSSEERVKQKTAWLTVNVRRREVLSSRRNISRPRDGLRAKEEGRRKSTQRAQPCRTRHHSSRVGREERRREMGVLSLVWQWRRLLTTMFRETAGLKIQGSIHVESWQATGTDTIAVSHCAPPSLIAHYLSR